MVKLRHLVYDRAREHHAKRAVLATQRLADALVTELAVQLAQQRAWLAALAHASDLLNGALLLFFVDIGLWANGQSGRGLLVPIRAVLRHQNDLL